MGVPKLPVSLVAIGGGMFSDGDHPLNCGVPFVGDGVTREGDLLILIHYAASNDGTNSQAAISGWTSIFDDPDGGADGGYLSAWWRLAAAGVSGTVSVPGTGFDGGSTSGDTTFGTGIALRGADPINPIEQLSTFGSTSRTGGTNMVMKAFTNPVVEYNMVLCFGGDQGSGLYTDLTNEQGLTWQTVLENGSNAGADGSMYAALGTVPAGGVTMADYSVVTGNGGYKCRQLEIARNVRRPNLAAAML